jgi:hypothetical protein
VHFILYHGWPLALALPDRVYLHPALAALTELDESDPLVRFACALAVRAFEIDTGLIGGPFDQARAERYARELLMRRRVRSARRVRRRPARRAVRRAGRAGGARRRELARRSTARDSPP